MSHWMLAVEPLPPINSVAEYTDYLRSHDWGHEYADDYQVTLRGRKALNRLVIAQVELDRDLTIWNSFAPKANQR